MNTPPISRSRVGATLVEVLVVIGVIGVLFSIAFPALLNARASGGQVKSLSQARDVALLLGQFAESNRETYLAVRPNTNYSQSFNPNSGGASFTNDADARWMSRHWWPNALNGLGFIDLRDRWNEFTSPGADVTAETYRFPSFMYSNSFVAAPQLWMDSFNGSTEALRDVRASEVSFPSHKVIVWDGAVAYLPPGQIPEQAVRPMAFVDGHASVHRIRDATEPVLNQLNSAGWRGMKLHNTQAGVLGRDFGASEN